MLFIISSYMSYHEHYHHSTSFQLCTNIILISIWGTCQLSREEKSILLPRWEQQPGSRRQPPRKSCTRLPSVRTWGRCLFLVGEERAGGSIARWVLKTLETITRLLLHFWYCENQIGGENLRIFALMDFVWKPTVETLLCWITTFLGILYLRYLGLILFQTCSTSYRRGANIKGEDTQMSWRLHSFPLQPQGSIKKFEEPTLLPLGRWRKQWRKQLCL